MEKTKKPWTFLDYFLLVILRIPVSPILSGTSFTILHAVFLVSAVAKSDRAKRIFLILNFPFHTLAASLGPVNQCLDLNGVDDSLKQDLKITFVGRPRFSAGFVVYFAEHRLEFRNKQITKSFSTKTEELRYAFNEYKSFVINELQKNWLDIAKDAVALQEPDIRHELMDIMMFRLKYPSDGIFCCFW